MINKGISMVQRNSQSVFIFFCTLFFSFLIFLGMSEESHSPESIKRAKIVHRISSVQHVESDEHGFEVLPLPVVKKINKAVNSAYEEYTSINEARAEVPPIESFLGPIYCMRCLVNKRLYMFKIYWLGSRSPQEHRFHFLMFDPNTASFSKETFSISGRTEGHFLFRKPLVYFYDLNQDGHPELVIQQTVHNGTMYNSSLYHYFHIGQDMSLNRILCLEARIVDLYTDSLIVRRIENLGKNEIKIDVFLQEPEGAPSESKLGHLILTSMGSATPFSVTSRHIIAEKYGRMMLTASGIEENRFIRKGYSFTSGN